MLAEVRSPSLTSEGCCYYRTEEASSAAGANGVLIRHRTESTAGVVVSQPTAMGYYAGARHKVVSAIAIYVDEE
jgi:hypothetical protein